MPTNETSNDLEEQVGREVTLRNNFERSVQCFATKLAERARWFLNDNALVSHFFDELLATNSWLRCAAAVTVDRGRGPEILAVMGDQSLNWEDVVSGVGPTRAAGWILRHETKSHMIPNPFSSAAVDRFKLLIVTPCVGPAQPISIFGIVDDVTAVFPSLLQSAAVWLGTTVGMAQRIRAEAQADAANMIAHMSSSSVELANFRLRLAQKSLDRESSTDGTKEAAKHIQQALSDLDDAQRALQRGLIWSSDKPSFPKPVELREELKLVIDSLNDTAGKVKGRQIVDKAAFKECYKALKNLSVEASSMRLRQSLRDAMLGAWMLSERTTLRMTCQTDPGHTAASVTFCGQGSTIPRDWSEQQLQRNFFDPEIFCLTSQKVFVERALTFDWTQRLLSQINAHLKPAVADRKFELTIDFQKCIPSSSSV